ncbi:MAG: hypothetical protein ACFFBP_09470 [Promethearchaeota archaeon]
MYFRKINNATLWEKIKKLRSFIQETQNFKKRTCFGCGKSLNIYDFLSDNLEFSPEYILKLWQAPMLEFHCCECFKYLKIHELKQIEKLLPFRNCEKCNSQIDLYKYGKTNNYLKIHELKSIWLNQSNPIFCDNFCQKKYYYDLKNQ